MNLKTKIPTEMVRRYILTLVTGLFYLISFSQIVDDYAGELRSIVRKIPDQISNKDDCDELIRLTSRLSDELDDAMKDIDNHDAEETRRLKEIQRHTDAIGNFLRTVGNTSGGVGFLKEKELSLVQEIMAVEMIRVFADKFCCDVFRIQYGQYKCLLGFIKGADQIYRLKIKVSSNKGRALTDLDRGLETNEYGQLWSNGDDICVQDYKILSIVCTKTP